MIIVPQYRCLSAWCICVTLAQGDTTVTLALAQGGSSAAADLVFATIHEQQFPLLCCAIGGLPSVSRLLVYHMLPLLHTRVAGYITIRRFVEAGVSGRFGRHAHGNGTDCTVSGAVECCRGVVTGASHSLILLFQCVPTCTKVCGVYSVSRCSWPSRTPESTFSVRVPVHKVGLSLKSVSVPP